ncbi:MAG: dipeptide/oligopeptide/nickel ABC transporter ATP-binding protein [Phascolarctobacterium sp.]|nr:dipeptide/oligopeptide/nickel ABC transporter ATP-binding protein [Phascolarctobacterium sp.]
MLTCEGVCKSYRNRNTGTYFPVLQDVNMNIAANEAVALMGKSGSGKSTLAKILLRLENADQGRVLFDNEDITKMKGRKLFEFRRNVQFISQRPESFLDPMMTLGQSIEEALVIHGLRIEHARIDKMLELVKLNAGLLQRYPHQVSGGEIQRICVVRALLLEPKLLVLDEPTSMLDVSVQAQVMHLFKEIKEKSNISYLYITHDLRLAKWLCNRVVTIVDGRLSNSFKSK